MSNKSMPTSTSGPVSVVRAPVARITALCLLTHGCTTKRASTSVQSTGTRVTLCRTHWWRCTRTSRNISMRSTSLPANGLAASTVPTSEARLRITRERCTRIWTPERSSSVVMIVILQSFTLEKSRVELMLIFTISPFSIVHSSSLIVHIEF